MEPVNDRVIMVSGATRGIGAAIADALNKAGYRLSLGARDETHIPETLTPSDRRIVVPYDARDKDAADRWVEATVSHFGSIDGVVNCAGISTPYRLEDTEESVLDALVAINVKGPMRVVRAALPFLKASGRGRVINVASLSGKRVKNDNVGYAMSKFAVMALTHTIRREYWDFGIRATAFCPSFVNTDMVAGTPKITPEDMIDPKDLAQLAVTVMALPNTASIAEMLVNCRMEDTV